MLDNVDFKTSKQIAEEGYESDVKWIKVSDFLLSLKNQIKRKESERDRILNKISNSDDCVTGGK